MNRTNRCYVSFNSRGVWFWRAHAPRVLAMAPRHRELFSVTVKQLTRISGRSFRRGRAKSVREGACAARIRAVQVNLTR